MQPLLSVIGQRSAASGAIVTVLVAALLFAATLQTDINGSNDFHMDDAGEFQVAWNTWGVTHPPGYPLINLAANLFTHLVRLFGARPALAASLFSMLLGLAALLVLYRLLLERTGNPWVSAVATLLLAVSPLFWINSSIAEVYTLGMLFTALILWRGLRLAPEQPEGTLWALAVILGLAVGHHRTLLLLLIPLVPLLLPAWRSIRPRTLLIALALFVLTFAVYLYLPLVTRWGSPWVYGRPPDTWEGFLDSFLGREYASQLTPPGTWEAILAAMAERIRLVGSEITPIGVLLGLAGIMLAVLQGQNRRLATGLLLGLVAYVAAPVSEELLYGTHMLIMVAALYLVIGWGLLWTTLPGESHRRAASVAAGLVGSGLVIWLARNNFGHIYAVTHDPAGREIIEGLKQVDESRPPVVEVWGVRYFALGYARWVSGELPDAELIAVDMSLRGLPARLPRFYTTQDLFHLIPPPAWERRLGRIHLSSAAYRIVEVSTAPQMRPPPRFRGRDGGEVMDGIRLLGYQAGLDPDGAVRLVLLWRAERPISDDYSVFVQVSDRPQITRQDDIIASGDRHHPVYGFYPTSRWFPGEIVREDYRVPLPPGRRPRLLSFGLYMQDPRTGAFHNLGRVNVPLEAAGGSQ